MVILRSACKYFISNKFILTIPKFVINDVLEFLHKSINNNANERAIRLNKRFSIVLCDAVTITVSISTLCWFIFYVSIFTILYFCFKFIFQGVIKKMLLRPSRNHTLAPGKEETIFIDGSFALAEKGAMKWAKQSGEKVAR